MLGAVNVDRDGAWLIGADTPGELYTRGDGEYTRAGGEYTRAGGEYTREGAEKLGE